MTCGRSEGHALQYRAPPRGSAQRPRLRPNGERMSLSTNGPCTELVLA
jgi:hypothetical protein